jgi:serine-type D-Ala-D-Ala carboxypeptidase
MSVEADMLKSEVPRLVNRAMEDQIFPGVEILLAKGESVIFHESYGKIDGSPGSPELRTNYLFDLASLTKPLATAPAILHAQEQGALNINDKILLYIPELKSAETKKITIKQLLTHTSGLPDWLPLYEPGFDRLEAWHSLLNVRLQHEPGVEMVYSCLGYLLLAEVVRRVSKLSLDAYCRRFIFNPLGLNNLVFNPDQDRDDVVPTAYCPYRQKLLKGVVHDENAFLFQGEGGNSGLFGTAKEIHQFCLMLGNNGAFDGNQLFSEKTVRLMTENQNSGQVAPRTMGWDFKSSNEVYMSCGKRMPIGSIGHLGFTGTSIWFDPLSKYLIIILSNRVNITREANIPQMMAFRPEIHELLLSSVM